MQKMKCFLITLFAATSVTDAIKVNLQGSLNLGKEVIETVAHFLKQRDVDGRRAMSLFKDIDQTQMTVKFAALCDDLKFCHGKTDFINEYVGLLAKAVEGVFSSILNPISYNNTQGIPIAKVFEKQLKACLRDIKKLLEYANEKITDETEVNVWMNIIKRISVKFQEAVLIFIIDRLDGDPTQMDEVKKKIKQKIIVAIILVEIKYERKLCSEHKICSKSFECTKMISKLLGYLMTLPNEKFREFLRYFYEQLPDTGFYSAISDETANRMQLILSEMAFSNDVAATEIIAFLHGIVTARWNSVVNDTQVPKGLDVQLINIILSDVDFFTSEQKVSPLYSFFNNFLRWIRKGDSLKDPLRQILKYLKKIILTQGDKLIFKINNEVRVFLEITVDL